ncbi:AIF_HP2_G0051560.mRNA.1.CDS.1 [Saccharomyces cerevisiae]|nr:AIF_HP2_G0051560.mRNA.1.CDS.1 [Saccharomyces cerevisiae]CAI6790912.1 AIF_HP2_G0051560.mRNA.1.CDS.1 [Saccharomyces cerevisiae]
MYESPAQGLDDIWYCHTGTNVSYLNNNRMIQVEINDTTGLFNEGLGMLQEQRVVLKQTAEEKDLVKKLTQMMAAQRANQPSASSSSMSAKKPPVSDTNNNGNNSVLNDLVESPINANTGEHFEENTFGKFIAITN